MSTSIPADAAVSAKFSAFTVVDVDYKTIDGVGIPASILTPKNAKPGKHPLIVRWHGGCLVTGHRLFPDWYSDRLILLLIRTDSIQDGNMAPSIRTQVRRHHRNTRLPPFTRSLRSRHPGRRQGLLQLAIQA